MTIRSPVAIGDQVYDTEAGAAFGSVREIHPHELTIYIEGHGDVRLRADAVTAVHNGKIIIDPKHLDQVAQRAILLAHSRETDEA